MDIHKEMKNELQARRNALETEKAALLESAKRLEDIAKTLAELDAEEQRIDQILETKSVAAELAG